MLRRGPWVKQIQHEAGDFDERLRARLGARFERLFSGGRKLTSPLTQALALPIGSRDYR